jgi:IS1 family transposase
VLPSCLHARSNAAAFSLERLRSSRHYLAALEHYTCYFFKISFYLNGCRLQDWPPARGSLYSCPGIRFPITITTWPGRQRQIRSSLRISVAATLSRYCLKERTRGPQRSLLSLLTSTHCSSTDKRRCYPTTRHVVVKALCYKPEDSRVRYPMR